MMMSKPVKIALIGSAGSGKDFIADILSNHFDFDRYAFADEVKRIAKRLFPEEYGNDSVKNRQLLIGVGMGMREIDPWVWVDYLIDEMKSNTGNIVVTDTRFQNEYWALKNAGFVFVRVNASAEVRAARIEKRGDISFVSFSEHESETISTTFDVDYEINNDSNEKVLAYASVCNLLADEFGIGLRFDTAQRPD